MTMADVPHPTQEVQADDDALAARFLRQRPADLDKALLAQGQSGQRCGRRWQVCSPASPITISPSSRSRDGDASEAQALFYDLLTDMRFVPNSPTFTGAGTLSGSWRACFVLPIEDDMGRDSGGIFQAPRCGADPTDGGGNGFSRDSAKEQPRGIQYG